jgi:hypothetical protein
MVEDKPHARESRHQFRGERKVAGINQQVVSQILVLQVRDTPAEVRPQHEAIVRFALNDMADTNKLPMAGQPLELRGRIIGGEIDPSDDTGNERMRLGKIEEPAGLLERLPGLNGDTAVDAGLRHFPMGVGGQEVSLKSRHRPIDPSVFAGVVSPEVDVGIDSHIRHRAWRPGAPFSAI